MLQQAVLILSGRETNLILPRNEKCVKQLRRQGRTIASKQETRDQNADRQRTKQSADHPRVVGEAAEVSSIVVHQRIKATKHEYPEEFPRLPGSQSEVQSSSGSRQHRRRECREGTTADELGDERKNQSEQRLQHWLDSARG